MFRGLALCAGFVCRVLMSWWAGAVPAGLEGNAFGRRVFSCNSVLAGVVWGGLRGGTLEYFHSGPWKMSNSVVVHAWRQAHIFMRTLRKTSQVRDCLSAACM